MRSRARQQQPPRTHTHTHTMPAARVICNRHEFTKNSRLFRSRRPVSAGCPRPLVPVQPPRRDITEDVTELPCGLKPTRAPLAGSCDCSDVRHHYAIHVFPNKEISLSGSFYLIWVIGAHREVVQVHVNVDLCCYYFYYQVVWIIYKYNNYIYTYFVFGYIWKNQKI